MQLDTTPQGQPEDDAPFVFEYTALEPRVAYTARLLDYPAIDALKIAEQRFRRELDKRRGASAACISERE